MLASASDDATVKIWGPSKSRTSAHLSSRTLSSLFPNTSSTSKFHQGTSLTAESTSQSNPSPRSSPVMA